MFILCPVQADQSAINQFMLFPNNVRHRVFSRDVDLVGFLLALPTSQPPGHLLSSLLQHPAASCPRKYTSPRPHLLLPHHITLIYISVCRQSIAYSIYTYNIRSTGPARFSSYQDDLSSQLNPKKPNLQNPATSPDSVGLIKDIVNRRSCGA